MSKHNSIYQFISRRYSALELLLLMIMLVLFLPYFILSFYNAPSVDDYSYALKTIDFGFWGGQAEAYKQWNGRYFASFLLCLKLISENSFVLYKILPVVFIFLSIHSIYRLVKNFFTESHPTVLLLVSAAYVFIYFNTMPSITQGLYWAPGTITYHLGNIMIVYFLSYFFQPVTINHPPLYINGMMMITIILACGLNESSMVVADLLILSILFYKFITTRKIDNFFILLLVVAAICTVIMAVSPGNHIRDVGFLDPHKKNLLYTIKSSFDSLFHLNFEWLFNWQMGVISLAVLPLFIQFNKYSYSGVELWTGFIVVFVLGFCIVAASLAPGFWSTGYIAPDRTINAVYWFSLLWWFASLNYIAVIIRLFLNNININPILLVPFILFSCIALYSQNKNFNRAVLDLISGRAYIYAKEWSNRLKIINDSKQAEICLLPEFTAVPGTLFNEDISTDEEDWFNKEFARFYNLNKVKQVSKRTIVSAKHFCFDFETIQANKNLRNAENLSNKYALSSSNSNYVNAKDGYSATYETYITDIDPTGMSFQTVLFKAHILSESSSINCVLVISISDETGKNVLWQGKDIISNDYVVETWHEEQFEYTIKESLALKTENKISLYLWNRGEAPVFVDDLCVSFK